MKEGISDCIKCRAFNSYNPKVTLRRGAQTIFIIEGVTQDKYYCLGEPLKMFLDFIYHQK